MELFICAVSILQRVNSQRNLERSINSPAACVVERGCGAQRVWGLRERTIDPFSAISGFAAKLCVTAKEAIVPGNCPELSTAVAES